MQIDPKRTAAIVLAWPDGRVRPELLYWLTDIGVARDATIPHTLGGRDQASGWNASIRIALDTDPGRFDSFIFAEHDIRPDLTRTRPFLDTAADVVGVKFDNGNPGSFHRSNEMHLALWRTRRDVLAALAPPWFVRDTDEYGIERACLCWPFNRRLIAAGYAVTAVGWADHTPANAARHAARHTAADP